MGLNPVRDLIIKGVISSGQEPWGHKGWGATGPPPHSEHLCQVTPQEKSYRRKISPRTRKDRNEEGKRRNAIWSLGMSAGLGVRQWEFSSHM